MIGASPRMVTLVREAQGWTQKEFAERLEVTQGFLSKVENGLLPLTGERLEHFAKVLECPPDLLTDDDPVRGLEVTCLHHRRRGSTMPIALKKKIEAITHLTRISVEGLLNGIDIELEAQLTPMPLDLYGDPAEVAHNVRAQWRIPTGPIPDVIALLESVGVLIVVRPLGTHAQDAVSTWPHEIGHPPMMLINTGLAADRQRFTIAHELGHLLMHLAPGEEQEKEANAFAGAFLAPDEEIREELEGLRTSDFPKLLDLKRKWGMSVAALIQRAKDLECISDRQFTEFRVKLSRLGWTTREPTDLPRESPHVLDEVVRVHQSEHHYSINDIAKLTKMLPKSVVRYYVPKEPEPSKPKLRSV